MAPLKNSGTSSATPCSCLGDGTITPTLSGRLKELTQVRPSARGAGQDHCHGCNSALWKCVGVARTLFPCMDTQRATGSELGRLQGDTGAQKTREGRWDGSMGCGLTLRCWLSRISCCPWYLPHGLPLPCISFASYSDLPHPPRAELGFKRILERWGS
jgi:hypothetical protein